MANNTGVLSEASMVAIYGLYDPRTGELRYIGKANDPVKRLQTHLEQAATVALRTHKGCWLRSLKREGLTPQMRVLAWVPVESWQQEERRYIALALQLGAYLTNEAVGGEGGDLGPLVRAKASAGKRGKPMHPNTRAAIMKSLVGRPKPPGSGGGPPVRRGEANNHARLTEEQVLRIRQAFADGVTSKELAPKYGVSYVSIWNIVTRRTWAHLPATSEE